MDVDWVVGVLDSGSVDVFLMWMYDLIGGKSKHGLPGLGGF